MFFDQDISRHAVVFGYIIGNTYLLLFMMLKIVNTQLYIAVRDSVVRSIFECSTFFGQSMYIWGFTISLLKYKKNKYNFTMVI